MEVAVTEVVEEIPESPVIQLPSLNQSDEFVFEGLRAFQNGAALVRLIASDQLIRKFVVFVENISRGEFPQTGLPYRALGQEMPVTNIDENLFVMDGAGFVSSGCQNPTLTMMALTARSCDHLIERFRRSEV